MSHSHEWDIDHQHPPEAGIMARCPCGEVSVTLPSDVMIPISLDPELDGPGDLFPPNWE